MAESKRTFQSAKMDRDADERVLKPGEYRDALNVSVDFSEDGNVGAIENLKGNKLIDGQDILGLSAASNPNAKVIGTYANPESDKIYYFVTGDNSDAIFEYDGTTGAISTVIIDSSIAPPTPVELNFEFSDANAQVSVAKNGSITVTANRGQIESLTEDFEETVSSPTLRKISARVKVPNGFSNSNSFEYGELTATQAALTAPVVIQNEPTQITTTSFQLNGEFTNDSGGLTEIGFYWRINTGGSSSVTLYSKKFIAQQTDLIGDAIIIGKYPKKDGYLDNPFSGVSTSDISIIDANGATVSTSNYTINTPSSPQPYNVNFSTVPTFPITIVQTSSATTLNDAYTAAQIQSGGTKIGLTGSNISSPFLGLVAGQTQSTKIAAVAFATNSAGTTLSDPKYFALEASSINRISGTEYVVVPVIEDALATIDGNNRNTDEINNRNIGYGSYFKTSGDCVIAITAPSSDGVENNNTNVSQLSADVGTGITFSPTGPTLRAIGSSFGNNGYQTIEGMSANTSYQVTIPTIGSVNSKTIRINNGNPSGTYYTSTLSLNLSGVFVAKASLGGAYRYNDSTSSVPAASYILGPVLSGETAQCIIPLNNVNTLFTNDAAQAFVSAFDPEKLTVTVSGKTEGVDYNYYIENTSSAIFGNVPGIIFEGTPSLLGTTPTVNITYTP